MLYFFSVVHHNYKGGKHTSPTTIVVSETFYSYCNSSIIQSQITMELEKLLSLLDKQNALPIIDQPLEKDFLICLSLTGRKVLHKGY